MNHIAPRPAGTLGKDEKIIVAVHGIGDQFNFATIQTVAFRFCSVYKVPAGVPLGSFHAKKLGQTGAFLFEEKEYPEASKVLKNTVFAEAYWADIPRKPVKEGHTVEESKKWATTIVERFRLRCTNQQGGLDQRSYEKTKQVLQEMIETIAVLDRLCFLASKAGIFTFDLGKILTDYLGDVQIVTEFKDYRQKILDQFFQVMKTVADQYPNAEIHIVAHSEGTVISFLGLISALYNYQDQLEGEDQDKRKDWEWIKQVRGYLTIGSPIDKHLILWPDLLEKLKPKEDAELYLPKPAIEWLNFYDFGDPIGFELDTAREWLGKHNLLKDPKVDEGFHFDEKTNDIGFSRYWFPGKAHNDYWNDTELFGYFIQNVVNKPSGKEEKGNSQENRPTEFKNPPGSKLWPRVTTQIAPYSLIVTLLAVAVYILYKAVATAFNFAESAGTIFTNVVGLTSLLAGVTIMARIPRLMNMKLGLPIGALGFSFLALIYYFLIPAQEPDNRFSASAQVLFNSLKINLPSLLDPLIGLAIVVVIVVYLLNYFFPKWGLWTLLLPGFLGVINIVIYHYKDSSEHGPLWPVALALAGFLYLWWLTALLFDLVFVWHSYIRFSLINERMRSMAKGQTAN
jgi:hypothetical protein